MFWSFLATVAGWLWLWNFVDIHGLHIMNQTNFGDFLTFPVDLNFNMFIVIIF